MHTHLSLFEGDRNAFYEAGATYQLSKVGRAVHRRPAAARAPRSPPSPTSGSTPTSGSGAAARRPAYVCWGHNNRSALVRVPMYKPGKGQSHARRVPRARLAPATRTSRSRCCSPPASRASRRATSCRRGAEDDVWSLTDGRAPGAGHRAAAAEPRTRPSRVMEDSRAGRRDPRRARLRLLPAQQARPSGRSTARRSPRSSWSRYLPRPLSPGRQRDGSRGTSATGDRLLAGDERRRGSWPGWGSPTPRARPSCWTTRRWPGWSTARRPLGDGVVDALGGVADPDLALLAWSGCSSAAPAGRRRAAQRASTLVAALRRPRPGAATGCWRSSGRSVALGDHLVATPSTGSLASTAAQRRTARAAPRRAGRGAVAGSRAVAGDADGVRRAAGRLPPRAAGDRGAGPHRTAGRGRAAGDRRRAGRPGRRRARGRAGDRARAERRGRRPQRCRLAVIGMGKCGGRELNYVSDVDVIFVAEPRRRRRPDEAAALAVGDPAGRRR